MKDINAVKYSPIQITRDSLIHHDWVRNTEPVGGDVNKAVGLESLTFQLDHMFLQIDQYLDCLHSRLHIFHA